MNRQNMIRTVAGAMAGALLLNGIPYVQLQPVHIVYAVESKSFEPKRSLNQDKIRIALVANFYKGLSRPTSLLTLTSTSSLQMEVRVGSTTKGSIGFNEKQARFSADDYKVKLLETDEAVVAQAVMKKAQSIESSYTTQVLRRGKTFFTVYAGSYTNGKLASQAADKLHRLDGMRSLLTGYRPSVVGPHYVQAGSYRSQAEAESVQQSLLDVNMDAYVVTLVNEGGIQAAVWVGHTETDTQVSAIRTNLNNKASSAIQAQGAIIHSVESDGSKQIPHYRVYGNAKWAIKPTEPTTIKVNERSNRAYRGMMEVSLYKEKLALVNEVPLEQYLLSVVGSEADLNWPLEFLKAQAVAARTFALYQGNKYEIANVVDTTASQAYSGVEKEHPNIKKAVEETAGEVLMQNGKLIEAIYHANAGGKTADPREVWGGSYEYFQVVDSPDEVAHNMNWVRGPYNIEQITSWLKGKTDTSLEGRVRSLVVTERGPSGRVIKIEANGQLVQVSSPDKFRYIFGDLPSTLFDIIPNGIDVDADVRGDDTKISSATAEERPIAEAASFLFVGKGNGHGIGMSQWGAKGLADKGYNYKAILQHYYKNVELVKG